MSADSNKSHWRRWLFWLHLGLGVVGGLVISMMAATGLLLCIEIPAVHAVQRQLVSEKAGAEAATRELSHEILPTPKMPPVEQISPRAGAVLTWRADASLPVIYAPSRQESWLLHPQTGERLTTTALPIEHFFQGVNALHRWLTWSVRSAEQDSRPALRKSGWRVWGERITAASCLVYVLLLCSGLVLWMKGWRRPSSLKAKLVLARRSGVKALAWQWHHVAGFWAAPLLAVVTISGLVMAYPWANALFFAAWGEKVPDRAARAERDKRGGHIAPAPCWNSTDLMALQQIHTWSRSFAPSWEEMALTLPESSPSKEADAVWKMQLQSGGRGQLQLKQQWLYQVNSGQFVRVDDAEKRSAGQRARAWIRWIHTGEAIGPIGQGLAALACLATLVLVWSGFYLSWRRLLAAAVCKRLQS